MINLLGHECQRLEHSSGLSIPNLTIELIPFRYEVGIKTRSKIFSSCPQSPNSILDAKRVLKLMSWWDRLLSKLGSEIRLFMIMSNMVMRLHHLRELRDSQPNSAYIFSHHVPLQFPVLVRAAVYWTDSNFSIKLGKIMLPVNSYTFVGIR